jgi:hypothetical protein
MQSLRDVNGNESHKKFELYLSLYLTKRLKKHLKIVRMMRYKSNIIIFYYHQEYKDMIFLTLQEEVIVRMTQPRYLIEIRKTIAERNMRSYHSMFAILKSIKSTLRRVLSFYSPILLSSSKFDD